VLGCNALQSVRHVIALIYDFLQKLVEFLPIDIRDRVDLTSPQLNPQIRKAGVETFVRFSLDTSDFLAEREDGLVLLGIGIKKRHDLLKDFSALNNSIRHRTHLRWKLADSVPLNAFRGVLDQINGIVEIVGEGENIFAVDWCIEDAGRGVAPA
jgi:hypothetical protein